MALDIGKKFSMSTVGCPADKLEELRHFVMTTGIEGKE